MASGITLYLLSSCDECDRESTEGQSERVPSYRITIIERKGVSLHNALSVTLSYLLLGLRLEPTVICPELETFDITFWRHCSPAIMDGSPEAILSKMEQLENLFLRSKEALSGIKSPGDVLREKVAEIQGRARTEEDLVAANPSQENLAAFRVKMMQYGAQVKGLELNHAAKAEEEEAAYHRTLQEHWRNPWHGFQQLSGRDTAGLAPDGSPLSASPVLARDIYRSPSSDLSSLVSLSPLPDSAGSPCP